MENIRNIVESKLKDYDLEGVEITDEDLAQILKLNETINIEAAINKVLNGIRKVLDEGLW